MTLSHEEIQERIDRTINNHQFTCKTVGYNIYVLGNSMENYTLPLIEWSPGSKAYNYSYLVRNESDLDTPELKSFIARHKYRIHDISFHNDLIMIEHERA